MANKQVILSEGKIVKIVDTNIDVRDFLLDGYNVLIVPEETLSRNNRNNSAGGDPRTEQNIIMQNFDLGTGCSGGHTYGEQGCGNYSWNEIVQQNATLVETRDADGTTLGSGSHGPVYLPQSKKFGTSSAFFKGKYGSGTTGSVLIIPNDCPGLTLGGAGGWSGDTRIEAFFQIPVSNPTYNQVLLAQGSTSGGGTGNSFKLYLDSSGPTLKFDFNNNGDNGTSTNYTHSLVVAQSTGLTLGQWHHVAILYKSRHGAGNNSEVVPYFNGASADHITTGVVNDLLNSDQPISIGALQDGHSPFYGYIDELHIQTGPSGGTVQGPYTGRTYVVPTKGATLDTQSTVVLMKFDGPSGCQNFVMDSNDKVFGRVTYWNDSQGFGKLGVRGFRATGLPSTVYGICGGFNYTGSRTSKYYGYVQGVSSGAVFAVSCTGGTAMPCDEQKMIRKGQFSVAVNEYKALQGLSGSSGNSGDLKNLFGSHSGSGHGSPRFHGNHANGFSIFITDNSFESISQHVTYINAIGGTGGTAGNYTLQNTLGQCVGFSAGHIVALYQDMWTFRQNLLEDRMLRSCQINDDPCDDTTPLQSFNTINSRKLTASKINDNSFIGFNPEGSGRYSPKTASQQGYGDTIPTEGGGGSNLNNPATNYTQFGTSPGKG